MDHAVVHSEILIAAGAVVLEHTILESSFGMQVPAKSQGTDPWKYSGII